ncbi:polysaccharide deacetylase family protein [Streptacidiphilus carbonis]|jgi:hypothetical protein|uniref:polysaccharide deacetylase family protein n=1 Tax=Streptacidiphilus carbonis TaxID=105422 RepID=UPI0005A98E9D|nr:polysaccharide deacetylase family protein [Streptacidiphilus carbonis]
MTRRSALLLGGGGVLAAATGGLVVTRAGFGSPPPPAEPAGAAPASLTPRPALWSQGFQPGHGWTAGGGGTASDKPNDTALFTSGSQSFGLTTAGNGVQSFIRREAMPPMDMTGRMIRLVFRVEDVTHLHSMAFYLGDAGLANHYYWNFHTHSSQWDNYVQSGEWVTVHLQWADATGSGGAHKLSATRVPTVKSGFTDMSFAVYDDAKGPVTCHLQAVELINDTTHAFPRGAVSITFDDSFQSVHDLARPVMDAHKFAGTIYNIADAAGTTRYLSTNQMQDLQDASGWEMAGHAYSMDAHNKGYDQLTAKQVDIDLRKLRAWLASNKFPSEHFAYPHGTFSATRDGVPVDSIVKQHFLTGRSIISETTESFRPAMPLRLKALTGVSDAANPGYAVSDVTRVGGELDRCAHNGDWLIFCFHQLTTGKLSDNTQISQTAFTAVMQAISDRGIPVVTVGEALSHYS